jgi:hypothetical protein
MGWNDYEQIMVESGNQRLKIYIKGGNMKFSYLRIKIVIKIFILCFLVIPNHLFSQTLDETIDLIVNNYFEAGGWFIYEKVSNWAGNNSNIYFVENGFTKTLPQSYIKRINNLTIQTLTNEMCHNWTMKIGITKYAYDYFEDKIISIIYGYGISGTMHQIQNGLQWIDEIDPNVVIVSFRENPNESTDSIISVEISVIQYNRLVQQPGWLSHKSCKNANF